VYNKKNNEITAINIMLIDSNGEKLGIKKTEDALSLAVEKGLDLVEVQPLEIPVCKLIDAIKEEYKKRKIEKKNSKHQKLKEIKLGMNIAQNDLDVKISSINKFLKDGHKVRLIIQLGRRSSYTFSSIEKKIEDILNSITCSFKREEKLNKKQYLWSITLAPSHQADIK
jgi:translation initiation factor IF-3